MARIAYDSSGSVRRPVPRLIRYEPQPYASSPGSAYRVHGSGRPAPIRARSYSHTRSRTAAIAFLGAFAGAIIGIVLARALNDIIAHELSHEKNDAKKEQHGGPEPEPPPSPRDIVITIVKGVVKVVRYVWPPIRDWLIEQGLDWARDKIKESASQPLDAGADPDPYEPHDAGEPGASGVGVEEGGEGVDAGGDASGPAGEHPPEVEEMAEDPGND